MPHGFPPLPAYPDAIDSDTTLYLVYDTTEAAIATPNDAWDEEIDVVPVAAGEPEIWADNGYVTLSGELAYYDAVAKDDNGKVKTLRRCLRGLGGEPPRHNPAGSIARGFVVAEHHNQLVDAIVATERFIGYNFDPDVATLDWRIRNLRSTQPIFDDFDCPNVDFAFVIESSDPVQGTVAKYSINITGDFGDFKLSFGDGNFTTSTAPGTHQYAANATIDPVITVAAGRCTLVQSPITRQDDQRTLDIEEPSVQVPIPVPLCPPIGDIFVEAPVLPQPDLVIPPIIVPGIDPAIFPSIPLISIGDIFISVPDTISLVGVSIPDTISLVVPDISVPNISVIVPSIAPVSFITPSFPDISVVVPSIPDINVVFPSIPDINVNVPSFPSISVDIGNVSVTVPNISVTVPTIPNIQIDVPNIPDINVNVPNIPDINVNVPNIPDINVVVPAIPDINMNIDVNILPFNINVAVGPIDVNVTVTIPDINVNVGPIDVNVNVAPINVVIPDFNVDINVVIPDFNVDVNVVIPDFNVDVNVVIPDFTVTIDPIDVNVNVTVDPITVNVPPIDINVNVNIPDFNLVIPDFDVDITVTIDPINVNIPPFDINVTVDPINIVIPDFNVDINVAIPDFNVDINVAIPDFNVDITVDIPDFTITVDPIDVNVNVNVDPITVDVPPIDVNVNIPDININIPDFNIDINVNIPDFNVNVGPIDVNVNIPAINVNIPDFDVDINVAIPDFNVDVNVVIPDFNVDVNVVIPDFTVTVDPIDVDVNVTVDPITVNVPPIDVNVNIPDIDIEMVYNGDPIPLQAPPGGIPLTGPPGGIPLQPPAAIPINVTVTCQCSCCGSSTPSTMAMNMGDLGLAAGEAAPWLGPKMFPGGGGGQEPVEINYEFEGFPSVLTVAAPDLPPLEVRHDIPRQIEVVAPPEGFRAELFYDGPPVPVAVDIRPLIEDLRQALELAVPRTVRLDASEVSEGIQLIAPERMPKLEVEVSGMPTELELRVVGMPETLPVVYEGPNEIIMRVEQDARVPLFFEGPPIPVAPISVTVTVDIIRQLSDDAKRGQCVMIVPCPS